MKHICWDDASGISINVTYRSRDVKECEALGTKSHGTRSLYHAPRLGIRSELALHAPESILEDGERHLHSEHLVALWM